MATFPAIKPNTRVISLGNYPQAEFVGGSGGSVRFLFNTKRVTQTLSFSYTSINETELTAIYDHYDGQQGSLIAFDLPAVLWEGYSSVPISAVDYQWRYAAPPDSAPNAPGRFSLTVTLESVLV